MRLVLTVLGALALGACLSEEEQAKRADSALIEEAKPAVAALLREPASATFSGVEARDGKVCGFVNGRNAFGGYGERTKFVFTNPIATLDPTAGSGTSIEFIDRMERCTFDIDYRTCRGEEGLPSAAERCVLGAQGLKPGEQRTEATATEACRAALERRFNEDMRPAELRTLSSTVRKEDYAWLITIRWDASGPNFAGLTSTGTCQVKEDGTTLTLDLMSD